MKKQINKQPIPANENERLEALRKYEILDSEVEKSFDAITEIASEICGVPISVISLVDENRQWFKSATGTSTRETPRDISFCQHTIMQDEIMEVPNAEEDPRFKDSPLVKGESNIKFYAGAQLVSPEGYNVGSLCVIDNEPKQLSEKQKDTLRKLAAQVVSLMELRYYSRELLEAKERAEKALARKSQFIASVSHETRTPLVGILGFTEVLLRDDPPKDERDRVLSMMHSSGKHLLTLLDDILDQSRLEVGKVDLSIGETSLLGLIEDVRSIMSPKASSKGLDLEVKYKFPIPEKVKTDQTRLKQVLMNLVNNSIKFTSKGKVSLIVSYDEEENILKFEVVDTGIGIAKGSQAKLFDAFVQADEDVRGKFGGTGLGLYISKQIVTALHGTISLESEVGVGTHFTVALPIRGNCEKNMIQKLPSCSESTSKLSKIKIQMDQLKGKVLIAEDVKDNRALISYLLKKTKLDYEIVENGKLAVEKAEDSNWDVILLDMQMPVMDGYEASREIRGLKYEGPIVALTANLNEENRKVCRQAGCSDFLSKPFKHEDFYCLLSKYLTTKNAAPSAH